MLNPCCIELISVMNILPKKRWHVRTKENVERVRRDEENARLQFEIEQKRILKAESETRLGVLKSNSKLKYDSDPAPAPQHHINLFPELQNLSRNQEAKNESNKEQKDWEIRVGLLKPLGHGSCELTTEKPWYNKESDKGKVAKRKTHLSDLNDPMVVMKNRIKNVDYNTPLPDVPETVYVDIDFHNKVQDFQEQRKKYGKILSPTHEKKLKKKKKRKKRKHSSSDSESDKRSKKKKLEKLRKERLEREKVENLRTQKLLNPNFKSETEKLDVKPKMKQKYNSQFNPEFVKSNYR